jgi:GNAT superfamily N-acetyltransferase
MLLDQVILKGKNASVWYSDTLYNIPIVPTILREAANLIDSGNAFPTVFLKDSHSVIWIEDDEDVISFIVFENFIDGRPSCFIHFSWVNSKYRGNGIRSIIQTYLEDICKKNKIYIISTQTFVKNESIDRSYEKIGLMPLAYMRYKKLK